MKPIAWIRPCDSEGAVLEWDKPHPSDCADPAPLYHGSDVDARIAELTTEVADLKSKLDFANAINADQDKTVSELTAEVAAMREALKLGLEYWADRQQRYKNRAPVWVAKARNALKDGV